MPNLAASPLTRKGATMAEWKHLHTGWYVAHVGRFKALVRDRGEWEIRLPWKHSPITGAADTEAEARKAALKYLVQYFKRLAAEARGLADG